MNVLVTGAFGNIGKRTVRRLLEKGYSVTCFDLGTKRNKKAFKKMDGKVKAQWGDIRSKAAVYSAVDGQDVIIHLAYIIPPESERNPSAARQINVVGTLNLIDAARTVAKPPRFIFTSSIAVYGLTQDLLPPRKVQDPVKPFDDYAGHKLECEEHIKKSDLEWTILRLAATPPIKFDTIDPIMYEVGLHNRIEFVHPEDVACALANAVESQEVWGKVLLIGGGPCCQMFQRDFMRKSLETLGIGMLPENAFSRNHYHTDWMDTAESQEILKYQNHTFEDLLEEQNRKMNYITYLVRFFRPLARVLILLESPYYPGVLNAVKRRILKHPCFFKRRRLKTT